MIRQIDVKSVHHITSAQVAVDLASCVKELVENALDANATNVEVKFKKYGLDGVEVSDNGDGIAPEDFANVTRKHHTSKISSFDELEEVETYGFRGEAMSSLCGLCDVTILTCTKDKVPKATRLEYDSMGEIQKQETSAGKKGTTINLNNIMKTIPVRRRDYEKNYKREFTKTLNLLQEFVVISPARITVVNTTQSNKRSVQFHSGGGVAQNIRQVWGPTATDPLVELKLDVVWTAKSIMKFSNDKSDMKLQGYISKPVFGQGRQSKDRQMFFINSRPCSLPQIASAVNEIYRNYNSTEYPCVVANLITSTKNYDVNVSPNKRIILLHQEDRLAEQLKEQLTEFFDNSGHTVPQSQTVLKKPPNVMQSSLAMFEFTSSQSKSEKGAIQADFEQKGVEEPAELQMEDQDRNEVEQEQVMEESFDDGEAQDNEDETIEDSLFVTPSTVEPNYSRSSPDWPEEQRIEPAPPVASTQVEEMSVKVGSRPEKTFSVKNTSSGMKKRKVSAPVTSKTLEQFSFGALGSQQRQEEQQHELESESEDEPGSEQEIEVEAEAEPEPEAEPESEPGPGLEDAGSAREAESDAMEVVHEQESTVENEAEDDVEIEIEEDVTSDYNIDRRVAQVYGKQRYGETLNQKVTVSTTMDMIQRRRDHAGESNTHRMSKSDIQDADQAEETLGLTIKKDDFNHMKIVGQFNKGFVLVTKVAGDRKDLFIVDQHASDEIYNFEDLKQHVKLECQPLAAPKLLQLTPVDEITVQAHLETIEKNGFRLKVDDEAQPGHKCYLKSVPVSQNTKFDERDLMELIYKIEQSPRDKSIKCSKVRAMLASRACRKSIMIGKSLDSGTMQRVVQHLATLDKPWNCPHGRPTLRHLMTIK